jgi:hypothetical protein
LFLGYSSRFVLNVGHFLVFVIVFLFIVLVLYFVVMTLDIVFSPVYSVKIVTLLIVVRRYDLKSFRFVVVYAVRLVFVAASSVC